MQGGSFFFFNLYVVIFGVKEKTGKPNVKAKLDQTGDLVLVSRDKRFGLVPVLYITEY